VKTKNLTTWSRLFSVELKYNITLNQSRPKFVNYYPILVISLSLILGAFFFQLPLFITTSMILLLISKLFFESVLRYSSVSNKNNFIIGNDGKCLFLGNQEFQLDANSRAGWFGCWLVLTSQNAENKQATKYLFLFKHSVSEQDYSRLSRIIKRLKHCIKSSNRKSIY